MKILVTKNQINDLQHYGPISSKRYFRNQKNTKQTLLIIIITTNGRCLNAVVTRSSTKTTVLGVELKMTCLRDSDCAIDHGIH